MQHTELTTSSVAPQTLPAAAPSSPSASRRNVLFGVLALALLASHAVVPWLPSLAVVGATLLAAELLLPLHIDERRSIRLSATFAIIAFLLHGALAAAVLQAGSWTIAEMTFRWRTPGSRPRIAPMVIGAAQQLVCGVGGGLALWLTLGTSPLHPPGERGAALAIYMLGYLACALMLGFVGTALQPKQQELPFIAEPDAELWMVGAFVLGAPAALFVLGLHSQLGFAVDLLVAFAILAALSYAGRVHLRLTATALEYTVLNEISRSLAGSFDLNKLYPVIYSRVRQAMQTDVFVIALLNEEQTALELPFLVENGELLAPRTVPLAETVAETVLRTGKPLYLPHGSGDMSLLHLGHSDRAAAAVLFVPLCLGDVVIGVLSAQSYTEEAYTPQQIVLLDAIGRIAAVAINNARLLAREKAVLRSREEFISLVAHELKNPLAALLGHTQLLELRLRQAEDKLRRPIAFIREQGERMNRLVEDLLDLSRADTGRLVLHLQRIDLVSLIHQVVEQQHVLAPEHQLVVENVADVPLIEGDALRLTQVLQNLLTNAIKYSPQGGAITIRVETWAKSEPAWPQRLRKTVDRAPCWAVVHVADTGIGIPSDQIGRIFDRFYRANNAAQLNIPGAGLGLSVCEGLVRAHCGVIWAESEWGVGSTFSFALPIHAAGEQEPPETGG